MKSQTYTMKSQTYISVLVAVLFSVSGLFGQSNGFNYKAIVTDAGSVLQNQSITVRFTILENGTTQIYQETHTTTTDDNGIIIVNIGEGDTTDNFNAIDWSNSQFLKVEYNTGSGYVDMGTTEFKTVPKAKFADYADTADYVNHTFWDQVSNGINSPNPIGVGVTPTIDANLHIKDVTGGNPLIKMESDDNIYTIWQSNRSGVDDYSIGIDGGNNRFQFANLTTGAHIISLKNDRVGINNMNPAADLDVAGTFKLTDGTQGDGKVLTSDASGNASWVTPATPSQERTLILGPTTAQPSNNTYNFYRNYKMFFFQEVNGYTVYVPYNLPAGTTINSITYYYYDNSSSDISFRLFFSDINTNSSQSYYLTQFTSSGASTEMQSETLTFNNFTLNDDFNRSFGFFPVNGTWPGDDTLSFRGIKITYTLP